MSHKIDFNNLEIQSLFKNFYQIPDYQREYVWGEKEVRQLMSDIYDEFTNKPDTEYFLGSLVVCKIKDSHKYEVIDGQQRLITLSLILNNLRRVYKAANESVSSIQKFLYSETVNEVGDTIQSYVVEILYEGKDVLYDLYGSDDDDSIDPTMIEGLPGKTIFDAHKSIDAFLRESFDFVKDIQDIKKFLGYLLNKVVLIQIETPEIGNALKIFETINERGLSLDHVDLLKNLLFRQIHRKDFSKLKTQWDKFKKSIVGEKEKEKPLRFLRYFIMANYETGRDDKGSQIIREDDIYSWLVENEKKCNYNTDPFGFVRQVQESSSFYVNLMRDRYHKENNIYLENISALVGNGFKQHFMLLLSAKNLKSDFFDHLVKQLETLLFYYNITREAPRDVEIRFAGWTREIRKIKRAPDLNEFIASRLKVDLESRSALYDSNFLALRITSMQKYKFKYLLAKLSSFVDAERTGDTSAYSLIPYLKPSIHIEHILPENPTEDLVKEFSNGNRKEYNDYVTRLGNFVLLEKPINTSIKRDFYSDKLREYVKSAFYLTKSLTSLESVGNDTSINRVNEYLQSFSEWNKSSIDKRQSILLALSKQVWKIELFNEN